MIQAQQVAQRTVSGVTQKFRGRGPVEGLSGDLSPELQFYPGRTGLSHGTRPGPGSAVLSSGTLGAERCQAPAGHPFPIRPLGAGPKGFGAPNPRAGIPCARPGQGREGAEVGAGQHDVGPGLKSQPAASQPCVLGQVPNVTVPQFS